MSDVHENPGVPDEVWAAAVQAADCRVGDGSAPAVSRAVLAAVATAYGLLGEELLAKCAAAGRSTGLTYQDGVADAYSDIGDDLLARAQRLIGGGR